MRTCFTPEHLADPGTAVAAQAIRTCVHCGFCTATCPTYVLLGDELDSPRGRIYLIKDMLENDRAPTSAIVKHVDRCLSCLGCVTTCPSGVNYMHLVDHARAHIEQHYRRPRFERLLRTLLARILPYPTRLRTALRLAQFARPIAWLMKGRLAAMLALAPRRLPRTATATIPEAAGPRGRVALLQGCAEPVLRPEYRAATLRLLTRAGYTVVLADGEGCCGALTLHLGRSGEALAAVRRNVDAWTRIIETDGLEAILITASGCGTMIKDYGFLLRDDPRYAERAARVSALACDISEFLMHIELPAAERRGLTIAYHPPCSLQHGQKVTDLPKQLLTAAGYQVQMPKEAHLCCGSAGTYNILQPEIAGQLGDRKAAALEALNPDAIASSNVGCAVQIGARTSIPLVHVVELIDWATGGPAPAALAHLVSKEGP